jgi:hypothetical protein
MLAKEFEIRPQAVTHVAGIYDRLRCDVEKEHNFSFCFQHSMRNSPNWWRIKLPFCRMRVAWVCSSLISTVKEVVFHYAIPSQNQSIIGDYK